MPEGLQAAANKRSFSDAESNDETSADADTSDTTDASADVADTTETVDEPGLAPLDDVSGVDITELELADLGATSVSKQASKAFVYTTVGDTKRAILLDLSSGEQQVISFEKRIRAAVSSPDDGSFVVLHRKQAGQTPSDATPADDVFLARSWGISILDVQDQTTRLVLTKNEPSKSAIWTSTSGESDIRKLYFIFEMSSLEGASESVNDVLEVNLDTFRTNRHTLPSRPQNIGVVRSANKIFVSQRHSPGRMTFIDVAGGQSKTITGYELNAGIK